MNAKTLKWLKKELNDLKDNYRGNGINTIIEVCQKYDYNKKACNEVIMDSLFYSYEDFVRIHHKKIY